MSKYTEKTSNKLLRKDLISIVLSQQTEIDAANSGVMDQILEFNENYEKLQSRLNVAKRVNSVLHGVWALELMGVPHNVSDGNLEKKNIKNIWKGWFLY